MPTRKTLAIVAGIVVSFAGLAGTIIVLSRMEIISVEVAKLMFAALVGMYVGFGVLIAVYRLIGKME